MNNQLFQQARAAYAQKDFQGALEVYQQCLQDEASPLAPGEMGQLYHQMGNCLVKLKQPNEAIQAYGQAVADEAYDARGGVHYNLGMAYAALHDYEDAVANFEAAASDAKYDSAYKAYTGMGNALLKMGKTAEAGVAFRNAALDEANPDPTKALLNLGVCFMALNRAADAVSSYESALQFDMQPEMRNRLYANLGQAYVATGQMQKAVNASYIYKRAEIGNTAYNALYDISLVDIAPEFFFLFLPLLLKHLSAAGDYPALFNVHLKGLNLKGLSHILRKVSYIASFTKLGAGNKHRYAVHIG